MARHLEVIAPLFEIPDLAQGPFEDRVQRFVAARFRLYRAVAPSGRAAIARASKSPIIAERIARARRDGRTQLEAMFASELAAMSSVRRPMALAVADALFQFEGVEHLCEHLGLTDDQAVEALRHSLRALLDPTDLDGPTSAFSTSACRASMASR